MCTVCDIKDFTVITLRLLTDWLANDPDPMYFCYFLRLLIADDSQKGIRKVVTGSGLRSQSRPNCVELNRALFKADTTAGLLVVKTILAYMVIDFGGCSFFKAQDDSRNNVFFKR